MEKVIHNDYRQRPIQTEEERSSCCAFLTHLEEMIAAQEDAVIAARDAGEEQALAQARTRLWRLLTKRQGVLDALQAYARRGDHL
jgi:hypothetical protein